jgi:membrane-bound serine protease (ClpP class)
MKQFAIFLLTSLDEIAIGIVLILLLYYFTNLSWWVYGIIITALATILAVKFYIFYPQFRKPQIGKERMIGLIGRAVEPLNPEGQVKIGGEIWKAKSIGNGIDKGEEVEVVDTEGLKLFVRKVKE